jgi:hypothetical protein
MEKLGMPRWGLRSTLSDEAGPLLFVTVFGGGLIALVAVGLSELFGGDLGASSTPRADLIGIWISGSLASLVAVLVGASMQRDADDRAYESLYRSLADHLAQNAERFPADEQRQFIDRLLRDLADIEQPRLPFRPRCPRCGHENDYQAGMAVQKCSNCGEFI